MNGIFETTNRELENYLYLNGISFKGFYKNNDYMTVWQYDRTEWLEEVLEMYGRYLKHKGQRRKAS